MSAGPDESREVLPDDAGEVAEAAGTADRLERRSEQTDDSAALTPHSSPPKRIEQEPAN